MNGRLRDGKRRFASQLLPVAALLIGIALAACGGVDGSGDREVSDQANDVAAVCGWSERGSATDAEMRESFVRTDGAPGSVDLLIQSEEARPGQVLSLAPDNGSTREIVYGVATRISNSNTGEDADPEPQFFPDIGLTAASGEVGDCVTVQIPRSITPGTYTVFMEDVGLDAGNDRSSLSAEVEVAGEPLPESP